MRLLTLVLAVLPLAVADAAPARSVGRGSELRLVFLAADDRAPVRPAGPGDATIEVGRVTAAHCAPRGCMRTVVQRRFRLRVDGGSLASRFVRVRAFLHDEQPGQRIRLDGRLLTTSPQLVDAALPLRVAVTHTLEIEVPVSAPEGVLAQTVGWIVEEAQ